MGKRDSGMEERPSHSPAKAPRLSSSTPPAPRASHEMIHAEEQEMILGLLDLPDETILQIFSYLPVLDLVLGVRMTCRRLHELSCTSDLWRDLTLSCDALGYGPKYAYVTYCKGLLNQTCLVSQNRDCEGDGGDGENTVSGTGDCTQRVVVEDSVQNRLTSLTESHMDVVPLKKHSITDQLLVYPRLQQLVLKATFMPNTDFLSKHTGLRSLTIDCDSSDMCLFGVTNLFHHLKSRTNLRAMQLKVERWKEPLDIVKTMWVATKDYFQTRPALTRLSLDVPVNDDIVTTILDYCEKLEDLQLSKGHLTLRVFKKTLSSPNVTLTALRLKGCPLTDPSMVYAIAQSFKHLKRLELSIYAPSADISVWWKANYGNSALLSRRIFPDPTVLKVEVKESLLDIQRLIEQESNVSGADEPLPEVTCPAVPTEPEEGRLEELEYLAGDVLDLYIPQLRFQPHLRTLVLRSRNPQVFRCISDNVLLGLVQSCQKLQHVDLRGYGMSPSGIDFLRTLPHLETLRCSVHQHLIETRDPPANGEYGTEKSLRHLELHLDLVTGSKLTTLCSYFPSLTSLTIVMKGVHVEDHHMAKIVSALPHLDDLSITLDIPISEISTFSHFSFSGLIRLLASGRRLRTVSWLVGLPAVPATRSLAHAVVHHPTLTRLTVGDCTVEHWLQPEEATLQADGPSRPLTASYKLSEVIIRGDEATYLKPGVCISVNRRSRQFSVPQRVEADSR